ncbi:hypothetical protein ACYOEI_12315 [Singulisphaera rosea]
MILGDLRQRDTIFQEGTNDLEPRERKRPGLIRQAGQGGKAGFRVR